MCVCAWCIGDDGGGEDGVGGEAGESGERRKTRLEDGGTRGKRILPSFAGRVWPWRLGGSETDPRPRGLADIDVCELNALVLNKMTFYSLFGALCVRLTPKRRVCVRPHSRVCVYVCVRV